MNVHELDAQDWAVYTQAFSLGEATRRFLERNTTKALIDRGLLDDDVTADLVAANERMQEARLTRVGAARRTADELTAEAQALGLYETENHS